MRKKIKLSVIPEGRIIDKIIVIRKEKIMLDIHLAEIYDVENRAFSGNKEAKLIFDALVFQYCKDIGAMAAVLKFNVDGIVLTAGMAYSKRLCDAISDYVSRLAPIIVLPGEEEMRSLAEGALRVLHGEKPKTY